MNLLIKKALIFLTPRRWLLRSTLSNGAIVLGQNRPGYGGRGVFLFRDKLEKELECLEQLLPAEGVFLDIGANTGVYTLKAAKHFQGHGLVIALEPVLEVLAVLQQSVWANGFSNVRLRNMGADESTGHGTLWLNAGKPNSFSLVNRQGGVQGVSVMTVSIDDLCAWERLERLDYIKIDAEGAETRILQGGLNTIARFRPLIQMETSVNDITLRLPGYCALRAPGSVNMVFFPEESPKLALVRALGWQTA